MIGISFPLSLGKLVQQPLNLQYHGKLQSHWSAHHGQLTEIQRTTQTTLHCDDNAKDTAIVKRKNRNLWRRDIEAIQQTCCVRKKKKKKTETQRTETQKIVCKIRCFHNLCDKEEPLRNSQGRTHKPLRQRNPSHLPNPWNPSCEVVGFGNWGMGTTREKWEAGEKFWNWANGSRREKWKQARVRSG